MLIQIYNENIRDLLGKADDDKKHDIKRSASDEIVVTDIEEMSVMNEAQVR